MLLRLADLRTEEIEGPPDIGVRWQSDYIAGVVRRNGAFVVIVDLARLFSSTEMAMMGTANRLAATA